jgi:predicted MPP superfamily phosphohydrolase
LGVCALRAVRHFFPESREDWVDITHHCIPLPGLHPQLQDYRLVQISDFHIGTWITAQHLHEVVELVNQQQPDLVAITGDFVTYHPNGHARDLVDTLNKLAPRDATLAVLGNHDHWTDPRMIRSIIDEIGAVDLSNRVFTVQRGEGKLHFAGVDDYMDGHDRLDLVLAQMPANHEAAVLLAHEPDFADVSSASGRFGLQISGHSHGGQICLPWLGSTFLPRYARKYPSGYYRVGEMSLYTNRGLGTAEFNLRWNCRPEISVFTLVSPDRF